MKVLIIDSYYPAFVHSLYGAHPGLADRSYDEQWRMLMDQCFGTADFYSTNLKTLGHEATEVVADCESLQQQWAKEHGVKLDKRVFGRRKELTPWPQQRRPVDWLHNVLTAQIKHYRPDVLHLQDMNGTSAKFLHELRPYVRLITGQIACPISASADFQEYDLVLSSLPHFVEQFQNDGLDSRYFNLGFEPRLLERLRKGSRHRVVFIGGLSTDHADRIEFLERVAEQHPIDIWGYGLESLSENSILRRFHHGELWALDMYEVLYNAEIALNHHINVAEDYANNMRLYEATGVGTLLVTDQKRNLSKLFEPGKEAVAYNSAEEALELIDYYLHHEEERDSIARAGQSRTLCEHTYYHRMEEFIDIVSDYL